MHVETHFCRAEDLSLFGSASTRSVALARRTSHPSITARRAWNVRDTFWRVIKARYLYLKCVRDHLMVFLSLHLSSGSIQTQHPDSPLDTTPTSLLLPNVKALLIFLCSMTLMTMVLMLMLTTMKRASVVGPRARILSGAKRVRGPRAFEFLYFLS